ncbi:hypothetical protein LOAG_12500 [Loa loa]|uniref:Uncharacterized protein n=1 Tax=Loa loa TaxID=7209 RepID=A0A1S0TL13_LOALO|nr:hypothetical protein LOAG_12500 [Loa loa]EFO16009.1 hypothetical protein LOAG_12500 [Loa loa]
MGGDYYGFSLPGPSTTTLYFLPLGATNETISQSYGIHNVSITVRQNNKSEMIKQIMKVNVDVISGSEFCTNGTILRLAVKILSTNRKSERNFEMMIHRKRRHREYIIAMRQ